MKNLKDYIVIDAPAPKAFKIVLVFSKKSIQQPNKQCKALMISNISI